MVLKLIAKGFPCCPSSSHRKICPVSVPLNHRNIVVQFSLNVIGEEVWLELMLVCGFSGPSCSVRSYTGFSRVYVLCLPAVWECAVCSECHSCLCTVAPSSLSLLMVMISTSGDKYLHWLCPCDGVWQLPLSGSPWIPACSVQGSYLGSTIPKATSPNLSIGNELNLSWLDSSPKRHSVSPNGS